MHMFKGEVDIAAEWQMIVEVVKYRRFCQPRASVFDDVEWDTIINFISLELSPSPPTFFSNTFFYSPSTCTVSSLFSVRSSAHNKGWCGDYVVLCDSFHVSIYLHILSIGHLSHWFLHSLWYVIFFVCALNVGACICKCVTKAWCKCVING